MKTATIDYFIDPSLRIKCLTLNLEDLIVVMSSPECKDVNIALVKNEVLMIGKELLALGGTCLLSEIHGRLQDNTGFIARSWLFLGSWSPKPVVLQAPVLGLS